MARRERSATPDDHGHRHLAADAILAGQAVLDIGGTVGALVLVTGPEDRGREVEVVRLDAPDAGRRTHTAIHERIVAGRSTFAGIYPELEAGDYRVLDAPPGRTDTVTIRGGSVSEVDWRARIGDSEAPAVTSDDRSALADRSSRA